MCWGRLPKEAVESPSLDGFKQSLDKHLSGMVKLQLLLPLGTTMEWMTSWSLYQPYVQQFSFAMSQSLNSSYTACFFLEKEHQIYFHSVFTIP